MHKIRQIHILYFTQAGERLAAAIMSGLAPETSVTSTCGKGCLRDWTEEHFRKGNGLVYIGACGIAVRAIAPHLKGKDIDPAVIVIDEKGQNVIPLLSGHLGGANEWAQKLAEITGGKPVLTTATDVNGLFAVDVFAKENDLKISDLKKAGVFTAALLRENSARVIIPKKYEGLITISGKTPEELQVEYLPEDRQKSVPEDQLRSGRNDQQQGGSNDNSVLISPDQTAAGGPLALIPPCIVLGMGCRKGKSGAELRSFAGETLQKLGLSREAVCELASIDVKKEEPGLISLAEELHVPFRTFSAQELGETELSGWTFAESERVKEHVGVGNVCERAAVAAGAARILLGKTSKEGMTICVGMKRAELNWKPGNDGRKPGELSRKSGDHCREHDPKGHLFVVGIGPGNHEGMTGQAARALEISDTIIGYSVYNELVKPYYPEKRYLTTPMTGEEARCKMALEEAEAGHTVSLICSGDPGVYGMAGLVLELAESRKVAVTGREGAAPTDASAAISAAAGVDIEIVSGVTAALSGAALLGAPLVHDFAVISLSDRLTPWELIEKRLRGAAEADLCIVLYNPSSRGRKEHLHKAAQILMEKLPESRVCGIADRIGREGERTRVMTLKELADVETDMFSTVFIGNSSTKSLGDRMVTPRGYRAEK